MISAQLLDTIDRCPRRYALERTHETRTITTMGLLYAGVEGGITGSALNADPFYYRRQGCGSGATRGNLGSASRWIYGGSRVSLALTRRFGQFRRIDLVPFGKHEWQSNIFESKHGLHRIILTSSLDDDALRGYAHAWGTVGELVALKKDIILTAVVVGAQRGGRRHSHWTKCFQHPVQKSALRFARRKGGKADGFTEGWREVRREATDIAAATWVDRMESDSVIEDLIRVHRVPFKADDARMTRAKKAMLANIPSHGVSVSRITDAVLGL